MKTLQKHKKVIRNTLLSLICALFFVASSSFSAKADTQVSTHTTTSYGDYTFQQGNSTTTFNYELTPLAINLTWNSGSWMKLDYNFKDKYSGTMKFTVTSNVDWILNSSPVYYSVYCDGAESTCYISSSTAMNAVGKTKTFSVIFTNATSIHFNVATGSSATFFNSNNTITISNASFTVQKDITDVYTDIHQLRTWWDLYIPGMSTNLGNISLGIDSIEQMINDINYYVGNDLDNHLTSMDSNIQTMTSDIALLKTYLDGVEGYIDQIEGYIDQIEGYIDTIETKLNTISNNITNIYNYVRYDIPDWKIPAYLFFSLTPTVNQSTQTYSTVNTLNTTGGIINSYFSINKSYYDNAFTSYNSFIISPSDPIIIAWYSYNTANFGESGHPSSSIRIIPETPNTVDTGVFLQDWGINTSVMGQYYLHYITLYSTNTRRVEVEFDPTISTSGPGSNSFIVKPLYFGSVNNVPDEVKQLLGLEYNNTYTRLLQQIVNGIGNISVQQINENNTNINNYNNYQNQINTVENNYYNQFNQIETNIENNNTFDFTGLTNDGVSVYNNLFTNMYSIPLVKWPVLITLLGLVIVIILG